MELAAVAAVICIGYLPGGPVVPPAHPRPGRRDVAYHHPDSHGAPHLRGAHAAGAGRDPGRVPQGGCRKPHGPRRGSSHRSRSVEGELAHAVELVELARAIGGFSIGVAAHPAGHPRSPDLRSRPRPPGRKAAAGGLRRHPVLLSGRRLPHAGRRPGRNGGSRRRSCPGSCPSPSLSSIGRMAEMGAEVPAEIAAELEAAGDAESVRRAGTEMATGLCQHLLDAGRPVCTSTPSIALWRPARSTPTWDWRRPPRRPQPVRSRPEPHRWAAKDRHL